MRNDHARKRRFYGTATVGEKGQVVVPAEAREALALTKGEKLLVFGVGTDMVMLAKPSAVEKFAAHWARRLAKIKVALEQARDADRP